MTDLFTAIGVRYNATELKDVLNGIFVGTAWPNTDRPYAVVMPLVEVPSSRTNKGRYRDATFTVEVLADDSGSADVLARLIHERLTKPPLEFVADPQTGAVPPGRVVRLEEGTITYTEEDQYWRAVVEFTATVTRP